MMIRTAVLSLTLLPASAAMADDWPCWRGPAGTGVSGETEWTIEGSELWRAEVGRGYSCTAVANGRVYAVGFFDAPEGNDKGWDTVFCLDAATGDEIWSQKYDTLRLENEHAGGTLTTPTVDGDDVFVLNREGVLRCFDAATGEIRWENDFRAIGARYQRYGFGSSPVVIGDTVYLNVDSTIAVKRDTGDIVWRSESLDAFYATPCPFELDGEPCFAVFGATGLSVVAQDDGDVLYQREWKLSPLNVEAATPIAIGDEIFISSAYNQGCGRYSFADGEVTEVFRNRNMRNKMSGCVLANDHLFGFDESMLKCLDASGEEMWRKRGLGNGSLMVAGDRLIVMSSKGDLIIAEAKPDAYVELSRTRIFDDEGTYWSSPVIANGRIYCRSSVGTLVCRDHSGGGSGLATANDVDASNLPAAQDLFARHLELIGGADAVGAHTSYHLKGGFEMIAVGVLPTTSDVYMRAPNQRRVEFMLPRTLGGRPVINVYDGTHGWTISSFRGNEVHDDDKLMSARADADFDADARYASIYAEMKTVGLVTFDDRDCIEVAATTTDGIERRVYFDAETGFLAGRVADGEDMVVFRDYKPFGALHHATVRLEFEAGTGIERKWTVDEVIYDEVGDDVFAMPASIKRMMDEREDEG